ncbi:malate dehydrogenase (quinone) [uncultured Thiothrix sp.]|uniref:malate dehydrogenase (quinone) n=1 Tax=uncultured Thiothrix sp. TaxID=223185 RepID=UPI00262A2F5F|nr:malate dehydrogenase (quinone) [uncultured Thiothrix sp.]HMT94343.1 malate dehydrogenase (quinone) [Thiolinea sp.]
MTTNHVDVLLVGAGIMSATLGVLLKQLDPSFRFCMVEQLADVAQESTSGWNNAGTGHAAYCELNYTQQNPDGTVNADKAFAINASFENTLQFWSTLVEQGVLPAPNNFINPTPHISFVWGADNVQYLRNRYAALKAHHLFKDMEYSEDKAVLREWMPLVMDGRDPDEPVAATRVQYGSDVNFGALCRYLIQALKAKGDFELLLKHKVKGIERLENGKWQITLNSPEGEKVYTSNFVFLGAGGGALPLLQMSQIPEGDGYGGFPVSGQWLACRNPAVVNQHLAKVYGKASIGAPPMSVPHLDTRVIDGQHALLFGPFAGFSTKFLKQGSIFDVALSLRPKNLWPMIKVGMTSFDLIKYLVSEVLQTEKSRLGALRQYYPNAQDEDWELLIAGQRVQIIKKDPKLGGKLEFGTEVVAAADGSLAALLGASPGASIAVPAMVQVVEKCFKQQLATPEWQERMKTLIPSYGQSLIENAELLASVRQHTLSTLGLKAA